MFASLVTALFLAVLPLSGGGEGSSGPPPAAASWLPRVSPDTPGTFPPPRSFEASYRITWADLEAAHADIRCLSSEPENTIRTTVKTATVGGARLLYKLDGLGVSLAERRSLRPLRLDQTEDHNGKHGAAHVVFTPGGAVRTTENSAPRKSSPHGDESKGSRPRRVDYPGVMDIHSALLHIRSLPLTAGEEKTFIVMSATTPYLATAKVLGRGRVKVAAGEFPAIECSVALQKINKNGGLEPYKSLKEARAWIADDADRIVVKVETQIFIGTVNMELEKVKFSGEPGR